ncbi:MAG: TlpA family protein disulfide reductase [Fibrobacterota bacterium]
MKSVSFFNGFFLLLIFLVLSSESEAIAVGERAPLFYLKSLDGEMVSIRDYCGKELRRRRGNAEKYNLIISFWATYCKPCKEEIPHLIKFASKHRDNTKLILISIDKEGVSKVKPFAENMKIPVGKVSVLIDKYRKTAEKYGVESLPVLFMVDKKGIVRFIGKGFKPGADLEGFLEHQLNIMEKEDKPVEAAAVNKKAKIATELLSAADINAVGLKTGVSPDEVEAVKKEIIETMAEYWTEEKIDMEDGKETE